MFVSCKKDSFQQLIKISPVIGRRKDTDFTNTSISPRVLKTTERKVYRKLYFKNLAPLYPYIVIRVVYLMRTL